MNAVLHTGYYNKDLSVCILTKNSWTGFSFMASAKEMQ
jgi:hypothetical protein